MTAERTAAKASPGGIRPSVARAAHARRAAVMLGRMVLGLAVTAFLVPAVLVTVARLRVSPSGAWVLLRSFTPYAVIPYTGAAVLLGGAALSGRGVFRVGAAVLEVGALAGLALHLCWAIGPYVGSAPPSGDQKMGIMSANLHLGQADGRMVLQTARRHGTAVLVLEEITAPALRRLETAGLRDAFRFSVGRPEPGRDGTMVFSRFPLDPVATIATSSPGYVMDLDAGEEIIRLVVAHPISPNNGIRQWESDHALIRAAAAGSRGPTMIVGDFNATMDHQPMLALETDGFQDAATQARSGWQPTWPADGRVRVLGMSLPPLFALDHVLLRGALTPVSTTTVTVAGTDHRALVAEISW